MLQAAPGRRFPSNSPHPGLLIVGMLILTVGAVAAAVGLLLKHAVTSHTGTFHLATASAISNTSHTLLVGTIWMWSGTITATAGVIILAFALRTRGR